MSTPETTTITDLHRNTSDVLERGIKVITKDDVAVGVTIGFGDLSEEQRKRLEQELNYNHQATIQSLIKQQ